MRGGPAKRVEGEGGSQNRCRAGLRGLVTLLFGLLPLLVLNGCAGFLAGKQQTSSTSSFAISPASVNFGKVVSGKKMSQALTLTNTTKAAVTILQVVPSSSQFTISGITLPTTLAAEQSTSLTVWMNGTTTGNVAGTVTIQGDPGTTPGVLNISASVTASSQAQMTMTPSAIDFGTVSVGSKATASLTMGNSGAADLTVSVITLNGSDFGISGIATPRMISTGQSVPVTVTFAPTAAGSAIGSVAFTSNDPNNPTTTLALNGTGSTAPLKQLSTNPSSLSFGSVATGSTSTQSITLTNTGNTAVQITSLTAGGTQFSVSGTAAPTTLNASQSTTLNVKYAPTATGNTTGAITVASDAQGSPLTIALFGTGTQAGLSISPASFDFGSVVDGQTKSQNFTVTNTGSAALTLAQMSVTGAGYSVSGLTTPATLAAGKSATFSLLFAPTAAGNLNGTVSILSNAPNSPSVAAVTGTGVAASVSISVNPTSWSFGSINAGTSSSKSVTLKNGGNSSLTISQINVSAKDVNTSGISTPLTLAPGQNAALNLTFNPKAAETVSGDVTISSAQGLSAVIPVSGTGVQSSLAVIPSSVSFGDVTMGAPNSQTLQLINSGTAVLTITQLSVTGSGFSASTVNLPLSLNPGASSTFNLQFSPQTSGSVNGALALVSNAPSSPNTVALGGTGVTASLTMSVSPSSLSFGSVNTGSSAQQTITITDTGNSSVTISKINVSGTGFSLSGAGTPVTLSSSQSLTITVQFNPAAAGTASGSVAISSNANGSPVSVSLSGTGVAQVPHTVALTWNASTTTVSGYNVYRSTVSGSGYAKVNSSLVGSLNYVDSSVQNGQTYYYVTTAVDGSGNESSYSNEAQAIIP